MQLEVGKEYNVQCGDMTGKIIVKKVNKKSYSVELKAENDKYHIGKTPTLWVKEKRLFFKGMTYNMFGGKSYDYDVKLLTDAELSKVRLEKRLEKVKKQIEDNQAEIERGEKLLKEIQDVLEIRKGKKVVLEEKRDRLIKELEA